MNNNPKGVRIGDRVTIYPRGKKQIYVADDWQNGKHRRQSRRPSQVTALHIDQFRAIRKLGHSSPKTMHHDGVMLKSFLRWCKQR